MQTFIILSGWLFGFAGFAFGFWRHSTAARDRLELREIRRRATAPYLVPSLKRFGQLYEDTGQRGKMSCWNSSNGNVLSIMRDEVEKDMPDGTPVILVIENNGESAKRVSVKLDGNPIELIAEPDFDSAHGLYFIRYPFNSKIRGKNQRLELWFECAGVQDTHIYRTEHGRRVLVRIDPA